MPDNKIKQELNHFRQKYFKLRLIKGSLVTLTIGLFLVLFFGLLEHFFWFSSFLRLFLLSVFLISILASIVFLVVRYILNLVHLRNELSNEVAAKIIGKHFPDIQDKLLNYLQLSSKESADSSLLQAALTQKTEELSLFHFGEVIKYRVNFKYAYILIAVLFSMLLVSFINPEVLQNGPVRIVQFDKTFIKPAPFDFILTSNPSTFSKDPYEVQLKLTGESIPQLVYLLDKDKRVRMTKAGDSEYRFTYPSLLSDKSLQFTAAGFTSKQYQISVYKRPEISELQLFLDYPTYTGERSASISNTGSIIVPEGTKISWTIHTQNTNEVLLQMNDKRSLFNQIDKQFKFDTTIYESTDYEIILANQHAVNSSPIQYSIDVIKDDHPTIETNYLPDTILFKYLTVSGNINDDYGLTSFSLLWRNGSQGKFKEIPIPLRVNQLSQSYFFQVGTDSLLAGSNNYLETQLRITDNDAINGFKSSFSQKFTFNRPDQKTIQSILDEKSKNSKDKIEESIELSQILNEELENMEDRMRNKKELGWQDKKLLEKIMSDRENMEEKLKKLSEEHEKLVNSQKEFHQQSQKLQDKSEQLQDLIEEVFDEETMKLYQELQKLLDEKTSSNEVLDQIGKIRKKERSLEKELERALELFKRLKVDMEIEKTAKKIDELGKSQEDLAKKFQDKDDDILNEQQELNKEFENAEQELNEILKLNQELQKPSKLDPFDEETQEIQKNLERIEQELKNKDRSNPQQRMKNTGERMKKLANKMQQMQSGMEMTMLNENIDDLRDILDNLIRLSFEEEKIIKDIREVQQSDPRFIELSQEQLQLIENAKVIEDSLLSLAGRVVQISSFVTREVDEINTNLDRAMHELKERNKGKSTSYQQFAMTSMNNLAILLDDVLSQMQMAMAEAMGQPKKSGGKNQQPNLSQMQQQLSEQIQELQKSGKSGRQLSEELARLAAEQAQLRQELEEMQDELGGRPTIDQKGDDDGIGDKLSEAIKKMEENEVDLVNKNLTKQLIERQEQIITRMLEAEESLREQQKSPEREGITANEIKREVPPAVQEYLNAKKKEVELLETIPLNLNFFYKKEVNDYFRRISHEQ